MSAARNLPRPPLPVGSISLAGSTVEYQALTYQQAIKLAELKGQEGDASDWIIACGLDIPAEEAHEWLAAVTMEIGTQLLEAIIELSGLQDQITITDGDGRPKG